jgi:hypothetical protein
MGASVWGRVLTWLDHDSAADSYSRLKRSPLATDETERLSVFFKGEQLDSAMADAAFRRIAHRIRASRILFVPAVLSGIAVKASRLRVVEYLTHQVRQLKDEGFEAEIADIDTGATVARNGERLAEILAQHHCPTWIVSHSKGGLDVLHALVTHPELQRFVDGWIAFQAPFHGSPVADVASGSARARKISRAAVRLLGADMQAIDDLSTGRRQRYMDMFASRIADLIDDVPITCVGTVAGAGPLSGWPTGRWMDGMGLKNDGLVPVNSTILPGARFVGLRGLGHGQVATSHILSGRTFEHLDLLKVLFASMLGAETHNVAAA